MGLHWQSLGAEPTTESSASCDCCGTRTNRISGFVNDGEADVAAYVIRWTQESPDHGVSFDIIFGRWGDHAHPSDRVGVSLDLRWHDGAPQFMVVDCEGRTISGSSLFQKPLKRSEVIGTQLANDIFAIVDAIYMKDQRLDEVRHWSNP